MTRKSGQVRTSGEMKALSKARAKAVRANERAIRRAARIVDEQEKQRNITAKYGARRKPAPVVVKSLDGAVLEVVDQSKLTRGVKR